MWECWQAPDGSELESCSVITTTPNESMAEINDRMPVILGLEHWNQWLDPEVVDPQVLTELLVPCLSERLKKTPVSSLVNSVRNESPKCLRPVTPTRGLF